MIFINRDYYKDPEKYISFLHFNKRNKFEKRAIDLVIEEEIKEKRKVIVSPIKEHYDIKSIGNDIRYIEVKAHRKPSSLIKMSISQFNFAKKKGNEYWIYIVSNIYKNPKIIKIQNPIENMRIIKERREGGCVKIYLKKKSDVNDSFK
jgi:hypothetical protein